MRLICNAASGLARLFSANHRTDIFSNSTRIIESSWSLSAEEFGVADTFDPYREALVMETNTIWPDEFEGLTPVQKVKVEAALHSDPEKCAHLEYVRVHTGFCRQITVTAEDMARIGG